ncbi:hypothetical protein [Streptomyces gilvosporeus]|uniref:hypothetical protein n=2 Tax=Actinomycetes TaxID=1760 RepID=UPI00131DA7C8|nr:hypothetical protein [Streptomyces gilvosporeus]
MTTTTPERIVSDSGLPALLRNDPDAALRTPYGFSPGSGPLLDPATLRDQILPRWREGVDRQVKALVKRARSTLETLSGDALYSRLDDPLHRRAALIAELFRTHTVVKNAGRLDVRTLQHSLAGALDAGGPLRFEIAWGQVKRGLAGLKTAGPYADLAEALAVGRLTALMRAAGQLLDGEVRLTVLTGGTRFQDALLTRPEQLAAYDAQRQAVADALGASGTVVFGDFTAARTDADRAAWQEIYRRTLAATSDEEITARLHTVAFNVDWDTVLTRAADGAAPHGVALPDRLAGWLAGAPAERGPFLIRAATTCLVNPGLQQHWEQQLADTEDGEDLLEDAIDFFAHIAWEATRRYAAIHAADREAATGAAAGAPSADRDGSQEAAPGRAIRLTVHEKRDRPAMPALAILGMRAPGLLPQHLAAHLADGGRTEVGTMAELHAQLPSALPVHLSEEAAAHPVFGWLAGTGQPLCMVSPDTDWQRSLALALDPEQG